MRPSKVECLWLPYRIINETPLRPLFQLLVSAFSFSILDLCILLIHKMQTCINYKKIRMQNTIYSYIFYIIKKSRQTLNQGNLNFKFPPQGSIVFPNPELGTLGISYIQMGAFNCQCLTQQGAQWGGGIKSYGLAGGKG